MSRVDIDKEFIEILGETHFVNLKKWYLDIIKQPCRYLVFMGIISLRKEIS